MTKTQKDNLKSFSIKAAVVVVALLVLIYCITSAVKGVWNPLKWGGNSTQQEQPGGDLNTNDGLIITDDGEASALSIKVTRIAAPISSEPVSPENYLIYKITATYEGESTTDKLDLSVAWANPSSTWATGKQLAPYFELQHEDGAFEAIATAKQAYGETIVLTGKIRNREITKSINLDYLAKPESINNDSPVNLNSLSDSFQLKMTDNDYAVGSVKPSKITGTLTLTLDGTIYKALRAKGWTDLQQTKSCTYDLLNPTDLIGNIEQFMSRTLSAEELKTFKYDLYWALYNAYDGEGGLIFNAEFSGNYYAMVNGSETLCGQINSMNCNCSIDIEVDSYEDLQTPLTDFDFGGDILFRD